MKPALGDRSLFPDLQVPVYCNFAAVAPASRPVVEAVQRAVLEVARLGMGAIGDQLVVREQLRQRLGRLLRVDPRRIGLPPGTTRALTDLAWGIDWRPEDRLLCFQGEFPSNVTPWVEACAAGGGRAELLPLQGFGDGSGEGLARVEAELRRGNVRLVAVSAVQFQTGLRMPLAALSALVRRYGAELAVDGIQAAGVLDLDLGTLAPHYFVAGSHKWWTGLDGLAVVVVAPEARWRPRFAGWLGRQDPVDFLVEGEGRLRYDKAPRDTPDALEAGVQTHAAVAALDAATQLLEDLTLAAVEAHVGRWQAAFCEGLAQAGIATSRGPDPSAYSAIVSVRPPPGCSVREAAGRLAADGVAVATPDGWLRVAPHWPNGLDEVTTVVDAFRRLHRR